MKPIGILGLGDLGGQLAMQIAGAGFDVVAFDNDITRNVAHEKVKILGSAAEVLEVAPIVHWAIPSRVLSTLEGDLGDTIIILHDSVMNNSQTALDGRDDNGNFAIVHYLMNDTKRVFVATDASNSEEVLGHIESIGLNPKFTTVKEHDALMAHSQGVLASFVKLGLRAELDAASQNGDLTSSAEELHRVLMNRELNWTQNTLDSILANPELKELARDISAIYEKEEI